MWLRTLMAALLTAAMWQPAMAQDLCVQCDGPSAMYRCSISDIEKAGSFPGRGKAIDPARAADGSIWIFAGRRRSCVRHPCSICPT